MCGTERESVLRNESRLERARERESKRKREWESEKGIYDKFAPPMNKKRWTKETSCLADSRLISHRPRLSRLKKVTEHKHFRNWVLLHLKKSVSNCFLIWYEVQLVKEQLVLEVCLPMHTGVKQSFFLTIDTNEGVKSKVTLIKVFSSQGPSSSVARIIYLIVVVRCRKKIRKLEASAIVRSSKSQKHKVKTKPD